MQRHPSAIGRLAIVAAVGAGVALRTFTTSDLPLDEAMSVNIARLPLAEMFEALQRDGHPPLYYLLLHQWIAWFGDGDTAVRSLSSVFSVATLPLVWVAGTRCGGRRCAVAAVVLAATSPFAIRYATEARMYALVMFITACGWLAVRSALDRPRPARLLIVGVLSGALLLTHYWGFYLVGSVFLVLVVAAWRQPPGTRRPPALVASSLLSGLVLFLPWASQFADQVSTTGTPWGLAARPGAVLGYTLYGFGGEFGEAIVLGMALTLAVLLGLCGRAVDGHRIELELRTLPAVRGEVAVVALALILAVLGSYLTAAAFAARYSSIVFPLFVLAAAYGTTRFTSRATWGLVLAGLAVFGLAGGLNNLVNSRTQAGRMAAIIEQGASPGDVVVYCPDQLGPAVTRLLGASPPGSTFPGGDRPELVDWVDYLDRARSTDPAAFARRVLTRAGGGQLWLVWSHEYRGVGPRCTRLAEELTSARPRPDVMLVPNGDHEHGWLYRFAAS